MKGKKLYISVAILLLLLAISLVWIWKFKPSKALKLKSIAFNQLPGWEKANAKTSLDAFKISCKAFLKQNPNKSVGSQYINLQAKDWHPICQAAQQIKSDSPA